MNQENVWAKKVLAFGKHAGKTYETVAKTDAAYCLWARNQTNPSGGLADFVSYLEKAQPLQPAQKRLRYSEPGGFAFSSQQSTPNVPSALSCKDQKLDCSHSLSKDAWKVPDCENVSSAAISHPPTWERGPGLSQSDAPPTRVNRWSATPSHGERKRQSLPPPNKTMTFSSQNAGYDCEHRGQGLAGSQSFSQSFSQPLSQPPYTFDPMEYSFSPSEPEQSDDFQCHLGHVVLRLCSPEHYTVLVKSAADSRFTTFVPSELFQALLPFRSRTAENIKPEENGRWSRLGSGKTSALMLPAETYGEVYHLLQKVSCFFFLIAEAVS